jgi:hypothetical protein
VAETTGVLTGATATGSETTGSSALASVAAGVDSTGASSVTAGVSVVEVLALDCLPLKVLRKLENGDFGFSVSSSLVAFSFLEDNHGRELLRFSLAAVAGVSTAFVSSPLVMASVGTVAGVKVDVANGSVASTAGMTGAVSLTGSASLAGTAGGATSVSALVSDLASFFGANLEEIVPKMLLRLVALGRDSAAAVSVGADASVAYKC